MDTHIIQRDALRFWGLHKNRDSTTRVCGPMFVEFMTEIGMIIVVLGVLVAIAYLAWMTPANGQAQMRRIPIRVRDEHPRRRGR